jgi:peptidoglycan/xylan/chitin deacetylase (PgdA/CDA1 family)
MRDAGRPRGLVSRRGLLLGGLMTGTGVLTAAPGSRDTGAPEDPLPRSATGRPVPSPAVVPGPGDSADATAATSSVPPRTSAPPDPAQVKANELGIVPVMMYHRIQPRVTGEYDMTLADFRTQLRTLFSMGMRPVRTIDLVRGDFHIEAGYTPVVLTFDDGYSDQFAIDAAGDVDPHSAVGILMDVAREFPDCTPAGSFNINKNPFGLSAAGEQRRGLARLHELGFEIANHTFGHDDLSSLDPVGVQEDLVKLQQLVESAVPGASVLTMALPFGIPPRSRALAGHGSWHGETYRNEGVLNVGAKPCVSPFARTFDPSSIPRIRATSWQDGRAPLTGKYWIRYMRAHRDQLYVAAGNPGRVTAPSAAAATVAPAHRHRLLTY